MKRALLAAAAILLAGCLCHHRHERPDEFKGMTGLTLDERLDELQKECDAGRPARLALCEKNGRAFAFDSDRGVIHSRERAWSMETGKLVWVESRSWSDVAICLPDAVDTFGSRPCGPGAELSVCDAIAEMRAKIGATTSSPR